MLATCVLLLALGLIIYYFLLTIEPFANPEKETYGDNLSYDDYIQIERNIMNFFDKKDKGLSLKYYKNVPDNMRWKIHRWSMWDYLPNLDYPYHCRIKTYHGNERCVPISHKDYCSIGNLYKTKLECENKRHAI
jgi:hypothetical protein